MTPFNAALLGEPNFTVLALLNDNEFCLAIPLIREISTMATHSEDWIQTEELLIEFDRRWVEGQNPRIESYIDRIRQSESAAEVLLELIEIDLEHQWKTGAIVTCENYLNRFAEFFQSAEDRWRLFDAELAARAIAGKLPDQNELQNRFEEGILEKASGILNEHFASKSSRRDRRFSNRYQCRLELSRTRISSSLPERW